MIIEALTIFVLMAVNDFIRSKTVIAISSKDKIRAPLYSVANFAMFALVLSKVVFNQWLILPAAAGILLGVWVGVRK